MKTCTECGIEKQLSRFYVDSSYKDGYQAACKDCRRDYVRAKKHGAIYPKFDGCLTHKRCLTCKAIKDNEQFYSDKAGRNGRYSSCKTCKDSSTMEWRSDNKDYYNASMRDYRAAMTFEERRDVDLKSWFDLPYGWYGSTLAAQQALCASCSKTNPSTKRCLAVDHNHETGLVRGIICYGCNRLLRAFEHAQSRKNLVSYLKEYDPALYALLQQEFVK